MEKLGPIAITALLFTTLLFPVASPAVPTPNFESAQGSTQKTQTENNLDEGRKLFIKAVKDEAAVQAGKEFFIALQHDPKVGELAKAYVAGFLMLEGRDAFWPLTKMEKVDEGLALIDKVVARNPHHAEIRLLRSSLAYHLPFFFNREEQAEKDAEWLAEELLRANGAALPPLLRPYGIAFLRDTDLLSAQEEKALEALDV